MKPKKISSVDVPSPPSGPVVLDSSAVLAFLTREIGKDVVAPLLSGGRISTVNYTEILEKLATMDVTSSIAAQLIDELEIKVVEFTREHAAVAASLRIPTRPLGLSLGDRACVALGMLENATVVTGDRAWHNSLVPATIFLIR